MSQWVIQYLAPSGKVAACLEYRIGPYCRIELIRALLAREKFIPWVYS